MIHDNNMISNQMFNYLSDEVKANINRSSFNEISDIFIDFYNEYLKQLGAYKNEVKRSKVKWACNASMGHGKSTVLECYLKWLISETKPSSRVPVLVVIRETLEAKKLEISLNQFKPDSCLIIDESNREKMESYAKCYQIVIITHSRMDNLALKIGNNYEYKIWNQYATWAWGVQDILSDDNIAFKRHRMLIVDEKPSFYHAETFDIGKNNNSLDWFDGLVKKDGQDFYKMQAIRSYIDILVAEQLANNETSITKALINKEELKTERAKQLLSTIQYAKKNIGSVGIDNYKKILLFEKLIKEDGTGRINNYGHKNKIGRHIIVANRIQYGKLGMNMLVLDGTYEANKLQYKREFILKRVENCNDYSRLILHQEVINTSKGSREREAKSTQETIGNRIKTLREKHNLFVLPLLEDVKYYENTDAIIKEHRKYFENTKDNKGIHLLNTTGKNYLKDYSALYMTSLPRLNPETYKAVAISIYGNDVSLEMNDEKGSHCWFKDENLERVYRGMLYAEILQIIHRCALRIIEPSKINQEIHVYMAFDDSNKDRTMISVQPLMLELRDNYLFKKAKYDFIQLLDMSLYGREDGIRKWVTEIDEWIRNNHNATYRPFTCISIGQLGNKADGTSKLGKRFQGWLNNQWKVKAEEINKIFNEYGYIIYEDTIQNKPTKLIASVNYHYEKFIFG